jgi:hypothetical protein
MTLKKISGSMFSDGEHFELQICADGLSELTQPFSENIIACSVSALVKAPFI